MAFTGYSLKEIASLIRGGAIPQQGDIGDINNPLVNLPLQNGLGGDHADGIYENIRVMNHATATEVILA